MGYLPSGGAAARSADTPNIRRRLGQQALSKGSERDGTPSPPQADSGQDRVPTSKTSNLAVLTLDQVFFSLATGLRFMPAAGGDSWGQGGGRRATPCWREPLGPAHSQMMAIMELKFPMLKHSRATSMKNSSMRVRCFFFTTWRAARLLSAGPTGGHPLRHQPPKGGLDGSCPGPSELSGLGWRDSRRLQRQEMQPWHFRCWAEGREGRLRGPRETQMSWQAMLGTGSLPGWVSVVI